MSAARGAAIVAVSAALVALPVRHALAFRPIAAHSPAWSGPAPYSITEPGSADLDRAALEQVVDAAMSDWAAPSCTSLELLDLGWSPEPQAEGDERSGLTFVESGWAYDDNAIAVTRLRYGGRMIEADILLNGERFTFQLGPGDGDRLVDAYSVILHEAGHYLGLGHSQDPTAAMRFAYTGGALSLADDDRNGICALYPSPEADCSLTGCAPGEVCVSRTCVREPGDGGVCAPCEQDEDCMPGAACLLYEADGLRYCGRACVSGADCAPDSCVEVAAIGSQCMRAQGGRYDCRDPVIERCQSDADCVDLERCDALAGSCVPRGPGAAQGEACSSGAVCASGTCFGGACTQTCDWLRPSSCPTGWTCSADVLGSCAGNGICVPGDAGRSPFGSACVADTDCSTRFCDGGICSRPCVPGAPHRCADGFVCQVGALEGCGSCQRAVELGAECVMDADCASRLCIELAPEPPRCTQRCGEGLPCPVRYECREIDPALSICVRAGAGLGEPCLRNRDCLSDLCLRPGGTSDAGPPGECTQTCEADRDCGAALRCEDQGPVRLCRSRPAAAPTGCACRAGRPPSGLSMLALLAVVLVVGLGRHRRLRDGHTRRS